MDKHKFLFMADAHIKSRTWTNNSILQGDSYEGLRKVRKEITKDPPVFGPSSQGQIQDIVIGGDWFDSNRPGSTDLLATAKFFKESGFKRIWYIRGNHDSVDPSFLEGLNAMSTQPYFIHLSDDIMLLENRCFIAGVDWMPSEEAMKKHVSTILTAWNLRSIRTPEDRLYLVLHTSFKHLLGYEGTYKFEIEDIDNQCPDGNVTVLVGDIHLRDTSKGANGNIFHSPGSLYPLSYDKIFEPSYVSVITAETSDIADVLVNVRAYFEIYMHEIPDSNVGKFLDQFKNAYPDFTLPAFVRIVLDDNKEANLIEVDREHFVVQLCRAEDYEADKPLITVGKTAYTLHEAVMDEAAVEDDKDFSELVETVISSDDIIKTTDEILNSWGTERVH